MTRSRRNIGRRITHFITYLWKGDLPRQMKLLHYREGIEAVVEQGEATAPAVLAGLVVQGRISIAEMEALSRKLVATGHIKKMSRLEKLHHKSSYADILANAVATGALSEEDAKILADENGADEGVDLR